MTVKDELIKIPVKMEKFFGGSGQMVKPAVETVFNLASKIPKGKLATLESLRNEIAIKHQVHTCCPAATIKALKLAIDTNDTFCYWRIFKKNGQLVSQFPGGIEGHAAKLSLDGIELDEGKKNITVRNLNEKLYSF
jgi:hypothetical protein